MNGSRWCDVIATFAPGARPQLVTSTFKGLVVMAGLEGPKKNQYRDRLQKFCAEHQLDFCTPETLATLAAAILNKAELDAEMATLKRAASQNPEAMYAELMTHVAAVNASDMLQFEPLLHGVVVSEETAEATARARDGRRIPVQFSKTKQGWLLVER